MPNEGSSQYRESVHWARYAVASGWLIAAGSAAAIWWRTPTSASQLGENVAVLALAAVPLVLASLVARHRSRHPIAVVLAAAGLVLIVTLIPGEDGAGPFAGNWMLLFLPLALMLLLVPDGRPASRFARAVAWALPATAAAFISVNVALWALPAAAGVLEPVGFGLLPVFFLLLVAAAAAPVARYRRASGRTRLQLRWVFVAGASLPLTLLLCWASYLVLGVPDLVMIGLLVAYAAIPAATAIAVLRPDWFDIDRVALATVTVSALSIVVLGALSIASGVAGLALVRWSPPAAIGATVVLTVAAVLLYSPLRHTFSRAMYPERERALVALRQLRAQVDSGQAEPAAVQSVLRAALRDPGLVVAFRRLVDHSLVTVDGAPLPSGFAQPVRHRGDEIGCLVAGADAAVGVPRAVSDAAAPFVEAVRLRAELDAATAELSASRERLVRAGYEERRRLERDLHDGAQQRLVALGMSLRVLQRTAPAAETLAGSLDAAVAELGTALAELRQLAHGMRPSALDDGIGPALASLVTLAPDAIELDVQTGELPDAIGTTAFFVASEAVTNAVKHADATRIHVSVRESGDWVSIRVVDDGCGGAVVRPTAGLAGLHDRVAALGGRLEIASEIGHGTAVEAMLPWQR